MDNRMMPIADHTVAVRSAKNKGRQIENLTASIDAYLLEEH